MRISKTSTNLDKRIETQMVNLEMIGKFGKLNKRRVNLNEICLMDFLKKLEEFTFKSFGFIIKAIMMNIKQGYIDIYKGLSTFLEIHLANNKKKNFKDFMEKSNYDFVDLKKNKTLNNKTFNNEETNYRTYNEITKLDNSRSNLNTSLINFSHTNVYNVIKESESILNEIKPIIINKSKKKYQQKENDFNINPYGLLKNNYKKDKNNSFANTQILANANFSSNYIDSTFNFDQRNEFSNNNMSNIQNLQSYQNQNDFEKNKDSENRNKKILNNKTLKEESKEYDENDYSENKQKIDRFVDIEENLTDNLFSSAINFGLFKEFPSINYNLNTDHKNKNNLNSIEENELEENYNNDHYENTQHRDNTSILFKSKEKEKMTEQKFSKTNSFLDDENFFTQTNNIKNSISKNSLNENSKINYFFALNSLEKKLSTDEFIQQELYALNDKLNNNSNKRRIKGLKYDKEIHINFYEMMINFLSKDLKDNVSIKNFSYQELMRRKVLSENRKLLKRCHEIILMESQLKKIRTLILAEKDSSRKESYYFNESSNLFDKLNMRSKKGKYSKSKRNFIDIYQKENDKITNNYQNQDECVEEKVFEIKNKNIPLINKSENLLLLNDYSKIKETEKKINISFLKKSKASGSYTNHHLNNINLTNLENSQNSEYYYKNIKNSEINLKVFRNSDLRNNSSKLDALRRVSNVFNKDSILNSNNNENSLKNDDFGTPIEVFQNNELSNKNVDNLKNFDNKYLNALNDIITEEDSNFNNNFFTNLETNNIHDNKNFKSNFNFEELPEENENFNEVEEESKRDFHIEENSKIIFNIKFDLIKSAIHQHLKIHKDKKLYYDDKLKANLNQKNLVAINLNKINNIFFENTENSDLGYMEKEIILKNQEDYFGNIFYVLLIESQKNNIDISQKILFGDIFIDN